MNNFALDSAKGNDVELIHDSMLESLLFATMQGQTYTDNNKTIFVFSYGRMVMHEAQKRGMIKIHVEIGESDDEVSYGFYMTFDLSEYLQVKYDFLCL